MSPGPGAPPDEREAALGGVGVAPGSAESAGASLRVDQAL